MAGTGGPPGHVCELHNVTRKESVDSEMRVTIIKFPQKGRAARDISGPINKGNKDPLS